jgi:AcrR family transcriptional regulator
VKNSDEIREQIIDAAREVFSRYGFRKSTLDEVAMRINKGKSSIYYYYPSKEDLFKAVVEKETILFKQALFKEFSAQKTATDKLRSYVLTRMIRFQMLANFYEAIRSDYLSHLPFINEIRGKYDADETSVIQSIIYEGIVREEFHVEDPALAGTAIVIAMKGLEMPLMINEIINENELRKRVEGLLKILFYGIVKK